MADNQIPRPYRSNEPAARGTSATSPASDPLAELARLIGQTDPFAEFGRDNARRGAAPQAAEPAADRSAPPAGPMPESREPYADTSYATGADPHHGESETPGYPPATQAGGYEAEALLQQQMPQDGEQDELYDDFPPPRRRMGVMAIAAVFALAVLGTAGALGYRALFGYSGPSQPPPVIKADTAPSKIVPADAGKAPNKLIYDRVADHAQDEKLVSREEQPIEMKPPTMAMPQARDSAPPASAQPAVLGSGVISSEPKRIRTIAIHPGQPENSQVAAPAAAPAAAPPAAEVAAATPVRQTAPPPPPPRVASNAPMGVNPESSASPARGEARASPPVHRAAPPVASNAPLSLSPTTANDATAEVPAARAPLRTASAPTATTHNGQAAAGSYAVQVSSQRSEAEAQASFRSLQAKYPNQLGGRQVLIHRVELGAKGIYYRAMVGPFASAPEANALCSDLKAAGGQCLIQRN